MAMPIGVELTAKNGDMFWVVLIPALTAKRQLGLLVVLKRNEALQLAVLQETCR
jgi:hypothetical protein